MVDTLLPVNSLFFYCIPPTWYQDKKENEGKDPEISSEQEDLFEQFFRVIKGHLIRQKQALFQSMVDETLWTKYAWIIERKFGDWNLKVITDNTHKGDADNPIVTQYQIPDNWRDTP